MMSNALKLQESVEETAKEVPDQHFDFVIIPISSGTIAAGVIRGFRDKGIHPTYLIHLGYSRSVEAVLKYLLSKTGLCEQDFKWQVIDEKYQYRDKARPGPNPPWPCNPYYDLKAFRWWVGIGREVFGSLGKKTLFWNIG